MAYFQVLFGLAAAFCWGTADYLSRRQSEKVGHYKTVVYSQVMTFVILLGLFPLLSPTFSIEPVPALVLVASGLINFFAFIFLYRAFHKGVVSVVAPVAYTYPAVTTVLSIAILGTFLEGVKILAIAGIIVGVILVSTRFSELGAYLRGTAAPNVTAGIGSAIGSSVFFGIVYLGVGYATPIAGYVLPALFLRGVAVGAGFLLAPILAQGGVRPSRSVFSNTIIVMGFLEAVGFLTFSYGISLGGGSLPVVTALSGMGGAVAASYALVYLRERLEKNQLIGIALSLTGVFTLLYLGG